MGSFNFSIKKQKQKWVVVWAQTSHLSKINSHHKVKRQLTVHAESKHKKKGADQNKIVVVKEV